MPLVHRRSKPIEQSPEFKNGINRNRGSLRRAAYLAVPLALTGLMSTLPGTEGNAVTKKTVKKVTTKKATTTTVKPIDYTNIVLPELVAKRYTVTGAGGGKTDLNFAIAAVCQKGRADGTLSTENATPAIIVEAIRMNDTLKVRSGFLLGIVYTNLVDGKVSNSQLIVDGGAVNDHVIVPAKSETKVDLLMGLDPEGHLDQLTVVEPGGIATLLTPDRPVLSSKITHDPCPYPGKNSLLPNPKIDSLLTTFYKDVVYVAHA